MYSGSNNTTRLFRVTHDEGPVDFTLELTCAGGDPQLTVGSPKKHAPSDKVVTPSPYAKGYRVEFGYS